MPVERVAAQWSPEVRELVAACLELLAADLHDEVEPWALPREMGGRGYVPLRHILWMHREPAAKRHREPELAGRQAGVQRRRPPVGFV